MRNSRGHVEGLKNDINMLCRRIGDILQPPGHQIATSNLVHPRYFKEKESETTRGETNCLSHLAHEWQRRPGYPDLLSARPSLFLLHQGIVGVGGQRPGLILP